jgi:hypothetical protein
MQRDHGGSGSRQGRQGRDRGRHGQTRPEASGRLCARSIRREPGIFLLLPDQYQSVIVLSELEGLKDGEITEILGVTLQAEKARLHRARAKLHKELSEVCMFYPDERNELACDRKNLSCK